MPRRFARLEPVPEHGRIEAETLARWDRDRVFERLREQNRGRPDVLLHRRPGHRQQGDGRPHRVGPHAQGRVPALSGAARLPPALPERLGLPGAVDRGRGREVARPELQARDRGVRARALRRSAAARWSPGPRTSCAGVAAARACGWIGSATTTRSATPTSSTSGASCAWCTSAAGCFAGHRSTEWCPRCGTSLSQHELSQAGVHQQREHPSLYVRLPFLDRPGEALVVWTTTPWTLPANVAAAVDPELEYGRLASGDWVAVASSRTRLYEARTTGSELVGLRYRGPFDDLEPGAQVEHRVIPWADVALDDRHRDRPHRARLPAPRTSSWRRSTTCRCSRPSTRAGASIPPTGGWRG